MTVSTDAITQIRQRLAAELERAARDVEAELHRGTLTRAAYNQGKADARHDIAISLQAWLDQLRPGRQHAQLRTALEAVLSTLTP
jgi:uncharacterized protein (DUF2164 family)